MVGGPCLDHITGWGKIALIGDASHPLSGMIKASLSLLNMWLIACRCIWLRRSFCHGRWVDSCAGPWAHSCFRFPGARSSGNLWTHQKSILSANVGLCHVLSVR